MKKILSLFILSILVTGCFGGGDYADTGSGAMAGWQRQEFSTFIVQVPPAWQRVDKSKLASSIPKNTVVVYASELEKGFVKNMNILKEALNTEATPKEYARANVTLAKRSLPDYTELSSEEIDIHGQQTLLHTFQARNNVTDNLIHFTQGYFVKDSVGYTVTCVMPHDALQDDIALCRSAVTSFELK
jgi:hypothetical protein